MIVIGLTGSIGAGKTTVTRQLRQCGAATLDSDRVVHQLLGIGGAAVKPVGELFPAALDKDHIDRKKLGAEAFHDAEKMKSLEAILHPLVRKAQDAFIRRARMRGKRFVVLDIPLLFETQGEKRCDATIVTTAPLFIQRRRVFSRPNMTEEKFARILAAQMPQHEKIKRADFVVHTGLGKAQSLAQARRILFCLTRETDRNILCEK